MHQKEQQYEVVINAERQYSVWPAHLPLPGGWQAAGFRHMRDRCLEHIGAQWQDMRERSLQLAMVEAGVRHG